MNQLTPTNLHPLEYDASFEHTEKDEATSIEELLETMRKIRETTYADTGHAMRSVHVKSHGLLKGELRVMDNLNKYYAQGLFARPATYPLLMRLSTTPGDMLPDSVSTPRGCAVKIIGVKGRRLPGSENDVTQDFVMVNGDPVFPVPDLKAFLMNLKLLAATTDKAEGVKVAISTVMKGIEKAIESVGGSSSKIKNMGGEPEKHILGETFFTQAPVLFGSYMAKLSLAPVSPELKALTGTVLKAGDNPYAIRRSVIRFFEKYGAEWELRAQLCTNLEKMPIEDASVDWQQDISPYVAVANVTLPPQPAWSEALSIMMDDGMSFSPWHGLDAHRPLGSIMRARKPAYEQSAKFRALHNGKKMEEPKTLDGLLFHN